MPDPFVRNLSCSAGEGAVSILPVEKEKAMDREQRLKAVQQYLKKEMREGMRSQSRPMGQSSSRTTPTSQTSQKQTPPTTKKDEPAQS